MALGQYVAGMGFSNVGLGLVHGMAHPLGAFYNTPHGVANAILLPHVMRYNADFTGEKYRDIARVMGVKVEGMSPKRRVMPLLKRCLLSTVMSVFRHICVMLVYARKTFRHWRRRHWMMFVPVSTRVKQRLRIL